MNTTTTRPARVGRRGVGVDNSGGSVVGWALWRRQLRVILWRHGAARAWRPFSTLIELAVPVVLFAVRFCFLNHFAPRTHPAPCPQQHPYLIAEPNVHANRSVVEWRFGCVTLGVA
jgi:hypothetical protein